MSAEKMREEYNAWYAEKIGVLGTHQHKEWFAPWSASRAAIEVELPSPYPSAPPYASYEGGWNEMREEAKDAIESLGLKVKP